LKLYKFHKLIKKTSFVQGMKTPLADKLCISGSIMKVIV